MRGQEGQQGRAAQQVMGSLCDRGLSPVPGGLSCHNSIVALNVKWMVIVQQ